MKPEDCQWIRKQFKNNKVWVAADPEGNPLIQNNKILIKYQLDQEHEYWVKPETVHEIHPNDSKQEKPPATLKSKSRPTKKKEDKQAAPPGEEKNAITIYTDGASSGNPGPSGIGVFMRYGSHEKEISRYIGDSTNNIAELTAIEIALKELKRTDLPIRIYTDSSYACGLLINGWKARKNISLVNSIKALMARFKDLKIIKVKGHSGISGNERADQLATSAITDQTDSS